MTRQEEQRIECKRLGITSVEQLCYGQPRPYANHQYTWKLTLSNAIDETELLKFCQAFLRNNNNPYDNWVEHHNDNISEHFKGYYELVQVSNNQYIYHVMEPFAG